jgi:hypothetical protein
MPQESTLADRILRRIAQNPGCLMDDLVLGEPQATWNQIFLEVDRLSRAGHVRLRVEGRGQYSLRPAH